jgi:hypothetical protein
MGKANKGKRESAKMVSTYLDDQGRELKISVPVTVENWYGCETVKDVAELINGTDQLIPCERDTGATTNAGAALKGKALLKGASVLAIVPELDALIGKQTAETVK